MPILKENRKLYPDNWNQIRADILERDKHRCKFCKVPNYAVGYRDEEETFIPNGGNLYCDAAGQGELPYKEAREMVLEYNSWHSEEYRWIVIVLTIAHLDHNPQNNDFENLAALCQRCHNRHDINDRQRNRKKRLTKDQFELVF